MFKKFILTIIIILCLAIPVSALNLMFLAQQETLSDGSIGYKLGPTDYEIPAAQCLNMKTVGIYTLFIYTIADIDVSQQETAEGWSEYCGSGKQLNVMYDASVRALSGLSPITPAQAKANLIRARWKDGASYPRGSYQDWVDAGSLTPVRFYPWMGGFGYILQDLDQ